MAANFWASSHCKSWIFRKEDLLARQKRTHEEAVDAGARNLLLARPHPSRENGASLNGREGAPPASKRARRSYAERDESKAVTFTMFEYRLIMWHLVHLLQSTSKKLKFSPKIMATAVLYMKRFFIESSFYEFDPRVVVPTSLYLATKVEEYGHIKVEHILGKMEVCYQSDSFKLSGKFLSVTPKDVYDCEIHMLQRLRFDLIVHHPHSYLENYLKNAASSLPSGESAEERFVAIAQTALTVLNDSYRADVCLICPPHLIALASIHIASTTQKRDLRSWFDSLHISYEEVLGAAKDVLDMYATHGEFLCDAEIQTHAVKKLNAYHERTIAR